MPNFGDGGALEKIWDQKFLKTYHLVQFFLPNEVGNPARNLLILAGEMIWTP